MLGTLASLMLTMVLAKRVDYWWKLTRRAGGHHQERGALERIFVLAIGVALVVSTVWFFIVQGPGPSLAPDELRRPGAARLLQAVRGRRRGGAERRAPRAPAAGEGAGAPAGRDARPLEHRVARVPQLRGDERLDLHRARARERLSRPPRRRRCAGRWRERHGVEPEQIVLGNGAAELLQAAALALLGRGRRAASPRGRRTRSTR